MNDKNYHPLPQGCVKNLSDKLFEKRKAGAMEVERLVKSLLLKEKIDDIERIINILGEEFILSTNCHVRKGGLIGLASIAVGLGRSVCAYSDLIVFPVLQTFRDTDSRVRYFACESVYNIMKILQGHSLKYLKDVFEALSVAAADPDASVRQVALHCDRLLRDIIVQDGTLDLPSFMPLMCERIYATTPFVRQFLVCWLTTLNSVPTINVLAYLPHLLDGLFLILGDLNSDIRRNCQLLLSDFLIEIVKNPELTDIPSMVNTLIINCRRATTAISETLHNNGRTGCTDGWVDGAIENASVSVLSSSSPERLQQHTALRWIQAFVESDSLNLVHLIADIIGAVLPCLFDNNFDKDALEIAVRINEMLMKTVHNIAPVEEVPALTSDSSQNSSISRSTFGSAETVAILTTVSVMFNHVSVLTRLAALRWIEVLVGVCPNPLFADASCLLLPMLLKLLTDPAPEVVHSTIALVGHLCRHPSVTEFLLTVPCTEATQLAHLAGKFSESAVSNSDFVVKPSGLCVRFLKDLINLFIRDKEMLVDKGDMIIADLCMALGAKSVYHVMSVIVSDSLLPKEGFLIVQTLNRILLTQPALSSFRASLREMNPKEDIIFFERLYIAWCHNPVALLSLCLLTENYAHCRHLIKSFGELAVSVEVLVEMDQLIQLIESPVFATLRLHLIDQRYSADLQETLYCLLMCLPQTEAFETLRRRLQCLPSYTVSNTDSCEKPLSNPVGINFEKLLANFHEVRKRHNLHQVKPSDHLSTVHEEGDNATGVKFLLFPKNNKLDADSTTFLIEELRKLGIGVSPAPNQS